MKEFLLRWWLPLVSMPLGWLIGYVGQKAGIPTWGIVVMVVLACFLGMVLTHWYFLQSTRRILAERAAEIRQEP